MRTRQLYPRASATKCAPEAPLPPRDAQHSWQLAGADCGAIIRTTYTGCRAKSIPLTPVCKPTASHAHVGILYCYIVFNFIFCIFERGAPVRSQKVDLVQHHERHLLHIPACREVHSAASRPLVTALTPCVQPVGARDDAQPYPSTTVRVRDRCLRMMEGYFLGGGPSAVRKTPGLAGRQPQSHGAGSRQHVGGTLRTAPHALRLRAQDAVRSQRALVTRSRQVAESAGFAQRKTAVSTNGDSSPPLQALLLGKPQKGSRTASVHARLSKQFTGSIRRMPGFDSPCWRPCCPAKPVHQQRPLPSTLKPKPQQP